MRILYLVFFLPLLLVARPCFAQSAHDNDQAFITVRHLLNAQQADSIYEMTGENFRQHVSREMFVNIAQKNLFPLGQIQEAEILNYKDGISSYKVSYTDVTLEIIIGLNKEGKIDAFAFRPYKEPVANKDYTVPTSNTLQSDLDKRIDSAARSYINKINTVGLAIGILKDGKLHFYGYGETEKGNKQIPADHTIFEIGSISKTFTATLLTWYVNEKKIALSDPVTKYLPDSVAANAQLKGITVQMLANHTSGLPRMPDNFLQNPADSLNPYKHYTKELLYSAIKNCKLQSKPGEQYEYSNLGTALLGNILEHISHKTYEAMVGDIICKPLGMQNTVQRFSAVRAKEFVHVYNEAGNATDAWDFEAFAPAGALHSTTSDLLKYAAANMKEGKDKLSKAMLLTHKLTYDKTPKVALGWHVITTDNQRIYWHNGGTYGSSSYLAFQPDKQIAVVILSNAAASVDQIALNILRILQ